MVCFGRIHLLLLAVENDAPLASSIADERPAAPQATALDKPELPSFPDVFRSYSGFVWRVLLRLGVAEADVEDVAQDVFIGVHRSLPGFEGRCSMRTFIYGICYRRAVDYRRRPHVRREIVSDEPPEQTAPSRQERDLDLKVAQRRLDEVLASLDEDKRAVFVMFEIEQIPMDEIAEIVGCPLQTAYSRHLSAQKHVQRAAAALTRKESRP